jgi:hypothetical protein
MALAGIGTALPVLARPVNRPHPWSRGRKPAVRVR